MPATEQTWYNQKLLHVVFGFTALVLLISTIWMFGADENREWKEYQRDFRSVEERLTNWRIAEVESAEHQAELEEVSDELLAARVAQPDQVLYQAFKSEVAADAGARGASPPSFEELDQTFVRLGELDQQVTEAREATAAAEAQYQQAVTAANEAQAALAALMNPDRATRKQAEQAAKKAKKLADKASDEVDELRKNAESLAERAAAIRERDFVADLKRLLKGAKDREVELARQRKFKSADCDAAKANLGLAVRDGKSQAEMDAIQAEIDKLENGPGGLNELELKRQAATGHRERLQRILKQINGNEDVLIARLDELNAEKERLEASLIERDVRYFVGRPPFIGKKWLELPILNAFNSPLKIDNLWTENLTLPNGSFGRVRRFDRCTTCHKGIDKTAAGSADQPAYLQGQVVRLLLQSPVSEPADGDDGPRPTLQDVYGFVLASEGLVEKNEAAVKLVEPLSSAATAPIVSADSDSATPGLQVGDVIEYVGQDKVLSPADVEQFLLDTIDWGQVIELTVRRGLPQPYASHPRLDLFVGSLSPHPLATFGCTSCHEGQGSATSFAFASHTPNDPDQAKDWIRDHGWFNNHHWIYPMYPKRFAEAACLKCHHEVTELEPGDWFAEPPAPKLVKGHELAETYGCYACHEINGYDGPDRRIGPDLRLEPNYYAAAAAVKADPSFGKVDRSVQELADKLIDQPENDDLRHRLQQYLLADARSEQPALDPYSHQMADVLQAAVTPGQYRKAGPSLRYVDRKLDPAFMYDWIREPKHFRPSTKMPQFFGLWDHLHPGTERDTTKRMERIEIYSAVTYLLNKGKQQPFDYLEPSEGCAPPSAERGKETFEVRGCLACHQHEDFPYATSTQGPNLSGLGDKFAAAPAAMRWLYTWVKQPTHYHARTKMPDLYLDPIELPDGTKVDPVADIAEYLLSSKRGWEPAAESIAGMKVDTAAMNELAMEYMLAAFSQHEAEEYLVDGIPQQLAASLKGAEVELVGSASDQQKLMYLGRKTIARYGCYACHDIPGFEDAKPIGTALADWGRKESSKLAFEHINEYLHNGGHGGRDAHGSNHGEHVEHSEHVANNERHDAEPSSDEGFYMEQIAHGDRSGFIWQKLREPRGYDYHKVANKKYTDRLRMPLFPIDAQQREAVVTFVLGLVADPPAEEFVYHAKPRQRAITEGLAVLQKYNCAGCHMLESEHWELEFSPDEFDGQPEVADFHYVLSEFTEADLAASAAPSARRGVLTATLNGMPTIDKDGNQIILDEEGDPIEEDEEYDPNTLTYSFDLWSPTTVAGHPYQVGVKPMEVPATAIKSRRPTKGGDLAHWLLPRVIDLEKRENPSADGTTAWGWLPPPLMGEGRKVQPEWLHGFLLEPYPIRPAVFLRMPKFNMSSDEATKLVNYFAAKDGADFPFEFSPQIAPAQKALAAEQEGSTSRLDEAMNIVVSTQYCVQCHLVGDFEPEGGERAKAPSLDMVQYRLRPEYVRDWVANPKRILPYTSMPVNIVYDPNSETLGGVEQSLCAGTSLEQVDALVDLLMNFGEYSIQKNSVADLVKPAPTTGAAEEAAGGQNDNAAAAARPRATAAQIGS